MKKLIVVACAAITMTIGMINLVQAGDAPATIKCEVKNAEGVAEVKDLSAEECTKAGGVEKK